MTKETMLKVGLASRGPGGSRYETWRRSTDFLETFISSAAPPDVCFRLNAVASRHVQSQGYLCLTILYEVQHRIESLTLCHRNHIYPSDMPPQSSCTSFTPTDHLADLAMPVPLCAPFSFSGSSS